MTEAMFAPPVEIEYGGRTRPILPPRASRAQALRAAKRRKVGPVATVVDFVGQPIEFDDIRAGDVVIRYDERGESVVTGEVILVHEKRVDRVITLVPRGKDYGKKIARRHDREHTIPHYAWYLLHRPETTDTDEAE